MAIEEIVISSAINSLGIMAVLLYLFHQSESKIWRYIWLFGVFLMMAYSVGIEKWSFQHLVVSAELNDMAFNLLTIILWCVYILLAYLMVLLLSSIFKAANAVLTGVTKYGKTEKKHEGF